MSEFLLTFLKVVGVGLWVVTCAGLFVGAALCDELKNAIKCVVASFLLFAIGFTVEVYGLRHWWKP